MMGLDADVPDSEIYNQMPRQYGPPYRALKCALREARSKGAINKLTHPPSFDVLLIVILVGRGDSAGRGLGSRRGVLGVNVVVAGSYRHERPSLH